MARTEIKCPCCGYTFDSEDRTQYVSYWGEDGPQEAECPSCETSIVIQEHVIRRWSVAVL
jgi:endogenous inhibitor of DNA gyrase (YacG/DUF329 family)